MATNMALLTVYAAGMTFLLYHVELPTADFQGAIFGCVLCGVAAVMMIDFMEAFAEI